MRDTVLGLLTLCTLSGCCPFGYTQDTYHEWGSDRLSSNDVQRIRTVCQTEASKKAVQHQNEFLKVATQACSQ